MRHVIYEERRAMGESYGVDMSAVVSWCKSGLKRINIRDWILTGILVLSIVGYPVLIKLVVGLVSNATSNSYSSYPYSSSSSSALSFASTIITLLGSLVTIITLLIILLIGPNVEKWVKRRWPDSHPGIVTYLTLFIPLNFFGFIVIPMLWLTIFIELLIRYYGVATKHLRRNTFNTQARPVPLDQDLERKLQENFVTGQRNVVAYSAYRPFAGAGYYRGGWSFVINRSKGAYDPSDLTSSSPRRQSPLPFTISSLYEAVEKDVWALDVKNMLEIEGKLYVHGQYLPEKPPFFNDAAIRPVTSVSPALVQQYKENPTEDVRYYQCLRFNFWRGEMIFTAFLRFVQSGKDLFTEINYLLLPPMKPDYYWVDKRENTPLISEIWQLYKRSLDTPLQTWVSAPFRLLRGYFYTEQQHKLASNALNNSAFDYGAATSLRQEASDDEYHLFFQRIDEQMYLKVIEKQILDTIANFLEAHRIDTSELRQRQQMILNNNTTNNNTNFNGTVNNSGTIATGQNATIHNYAQQQTAPQQKAETINALFVLANPRGSDSLRLNTEMRAIEEALRLSHQRERIHSRTLHAATANDLRRALLEQPYQIVHLAGHGEPNGFVLENDQGRPHVVSQEALAEHFRIYRQTLRCVLLNACNTFSTGQRVALGIPYAIAMSGPIYDRAAIEFSRGFYDAIGAGEDIERAYIEGLSAVRLAGQDHNFLALLLRE